MQRSIEEEEKIRNWLVLSLIIAIGGASILLSIGMLTTLVLAGSPKTIAPSPTHPNLPYLLASEPTSIHAQATLEPQLISPTEIMEPIPTSIEASPTPTPLFLFNDQKPSIIGYSTEGRPLEVYTFGQGEHERMIVAGIHGGDEWNTITLANELIVYLNQYPSVVPDGVTLYILPNLNPDAEARAHGKQGRLNHNGVDLNRNFPTNWQADWDKEGCWNYLPLSSGTGPGSEAETRALMTFINAHHVEELISYHSAALGIFPGGDPWDERSISFAQSIAEVSTYPFPPIDTGCKYTGTLADYAVSLGAVAVDLELSDHKYTDFDMNLKILDVLLNRQP